MGLFLALKVLAVGASLGACAPLVVITILLQRDVRRRSRSAGPSWPLPLLSRMLIR